MTRPASLLLVLMLLGGCESINETLVRQMHKDWGLGRKTYHQIREGLEKRKGTPEGVPKKQAPPFLDQG